MKYLTFGLLLRFCVFSLSGTFALSASVPNCAVLVEAVERFYPEGHQNYFRFVLADASSISATIANHFPEINQSALHSILTFALENGASHSPLEARPRLGGEFSSLTRSAVLELETSAIQIRVENKIKPTHEFANSLSDRVFISGEAPFTVPVEERDPIPAVDVGVRAGGRGIRNITEQLAFLQTDDSVEKPSVRFITKPDRRVVFELRIPVSPKAIADYWNPPAEDGGEDW